MAWYRDTKAAHGGIWRCSGVPHVLLTSHDLLKLLKYNYTTLEAFTYNKNLIQSPPSPLWLSERMYYKTTSYSVFLFWTQHIWHDRNSATKCVQTNVVLCFWHTSIYNITHGSSGTTVSYLAMLFNILNVTLHFSTFRISQIIQYLNKCKLFLLKEKIFSLNKLVDC